MEILATWFIIYLIYSFGGWVVELLVTGFEKCKLTNRGFLVGPICPIYGTGAVILSLLLAQAESPIAIFCVAMVGGVVLEYTTSWLMEVLFHVRWWDYSNHTFNINGRVCLQAALCFGLAGILIVKVTTPMLLNIIGSLPPIIMFVIAGVLLLCLIADIILSLWLILGVKVTVNTVEKDATEEISERVRDILMERSRLHRRLVKAFPGQTPSKRPPRKSKK